MIYKFQFEDNVDESLKYFKTLREIQEYLNIPYHQVRSIYLQSIKPKKYLHEHLKILCNRYSIYGITISHDGTTILIHS